MTRKNSFNLTNAEAQMRKGSLEFTILLIISQGEIYASDIIKELKALDLIVVAGTLYPILSRLNRPGLLNYSWVESEAGPPRKYYTLTPAGREAIDHITSGGDGRITSIRHFI